MKNVKAARAAMVVWEALVASPEKRFQAAVKAAEERLIDEEEEMPRAAAYRAAVKIVTEALLVRAS